MKTFREFMLIAEAVEDIFGTEEERKRVAERDAAQARRRSARTGMSPEVEEAENKRKAFEKAGLSPEEARRRAYRNVKGNTTNVSGKDVRSGSQTRTQTPPRQPSGTSTQTPPRSTQTRTQTPPRGAQAGTQTPPKAEPKASQSAYKGRNVGNKVPDDYEEYMRKHSGTPKNMADMDEREFNRRYGGNARAQTARDIGKQQGYGSSQTSSSPPKASTPPQKPPTSNAPAPSTKPAAVTPKGPGLRARLGKFVGPAATVAGGALEYKARRDEGQSRSRAAGGALASGIGFAKGASLGFRMTPGPTPVKLAGAAAGGLAGEAGVTKAYDYVANKSRPARQAVAKATGFDKFQQKNQLIKQGSSLQKAQQTVDTRGARQVAARSGAYGANKGSAVTGIGGKTTTSKDTKGNAFISTGSGSQRRTVQLAKTQLIRDPKSGKQVVGDLAFKGGKATYLARPSVASRDTGLGGVFRNISRSTGIGGQRERDAAAAKQEYRTALKNTQTYQKKLGITPQAATAQKLPGRGVGPAKVGPKKVGPKLVGPKKVGTGAKPSATVKPA